jgi:hypothetical protein
MRSQASNQALDHGRRAPGAGTQMRLEAKRATAVSASDTDVSQIGVAHPA